MSDDRFNNALDFYWRPENDGQAYHETEGDAGGLTSWGVTWKTWIAWRELHGTDGPGGTRDEFIRLPRDACRPLYRTGFWNPIHGDSLPFGIGLLVFDSACMSGVSRAGRWLQRVAQVMQDGAIGPATLAAVAALDPADVIDRFTGIRADFYRSIAWSTPSNARFLDGWLRRSRDGQVAALAAAIAATGQPAAAAVP